jgi:flavin reductase (DIM6/NTAB) family NADH-FMN oxidoreductase RutF
VKRTLTPKIHYYGTPVVLLSTINEDGSPNLAPMSSAWWLGQSCMLGLGTRGQTYRNLERHGEVVLNLASAALVGAVDRLALTTGMNPVPGYKAAMGFEYVSDKFARAGLIAEASDIVAPPRVAEALISLEARVTRITPFGGADAHHAAIEVGIVRAHYDESILDDAQRHHMNPDKWQPLIMNFLEFYTLSPSLADSRLAKVF